MPGVSADLSIAKTGSPDPITVGEQLTYTLAVTNGGPDTATGVAITDALPTGVNLVSSSASQGGCSTAAGVVTCPIGTMARARLRPSPSSPRLSWSCTLVNDSDPSTVAPLTRTRRQLPTATTVVDAPPTWTRPEPGRGPAAAARSRCRGRLDHHRHDWPRHDHGDARPRRGRSGRRPRQGTWPAGNDVTWGEKGRDKLLRRGVAGTVRGGDGQGPDRPEARVATGLRGGKGGDRCRRRRAAASRGAVASVVAEAVLSAPRSICRASLESQLQALDTSRRMTRAKRGAELVGAGERGTLLEALARRLHPRDNHARSAGSGPAGVRDVGRRRGRSSS